MEQHWTYSLPQASLQGEEEENGGAGEIQLHIPPRQDQIQPQDRGAAGDRGTNWEEITSNYQTTSRGCFVGRSGTRNGLEVRKMLPWTGMNLKSQ